MLFRLDLSLAFNTEAEVVTILNYIEQIKEKSYKPLGTENNSVLQSCHYHKCSHNDECPDVGNVKECKDFIFLDFNTPKKVHVIKG